MALSEAFEILNSVNIQEEDLNGHIVKIKTNSEKILTIADSVSPMSFLEHFLRKNDKKTMPKGPLRDIQILETLPVITENILFQKDA